MRYLSINEVLQSPGLTWEELCERAEKEIEERREKYQKLQAKRKMIREKLTWDAAKTALPFRGETLMTESKNEKSESEEGTRAIEEQNEELVKIEGGKKMDYANDETSLQPEAKVS